MKIRPSVLFIMRISLTLGLLGRLVGALRPLSVSAAETGGKVVRVGWYESPYNISDSNGKRSGYAYEYQQKIAAYTGWTYEYVKGSWVDLLEMLQRGELDLMSDVSYTDERAKTMSYADLPMGSENYYVFISKDNEQITPDNPYSLDGMRIGINKGSYQEALLKEWVTARKIKAEIVELAIGDYRAWEKIMDGTIDGYVSVDAFESYGDVLPIFKVGASDFYFTVNRKRIDLLKELNQAMERIQEEDRFYNQHMWDTYIRIGGAERFLSSSELEWMSSHGPIRVGYSNDSSPFCNLNKESAELEGMLRDYLEASANIMENAQLDFVPIAYETTSRAMEAMLAGEIDAVFPVSMMLSDAEDLGVINTNTILKVQLTALVSDRRYNEFRLDGPVTVAVNSGNISYLQEMEKNFPYWSIVFYSDIPSCLKAVWKGEADCVVVTSYRLSSLSRLMDRYRLVGASTGADTEVKFAVKRSDTQLCSILNKIDNLITESDAGNMVIANSIRDTSVSLGDVIRENIWVLAEGLVAFIALMVLFWTRYAQAKKAEKNTRKENLEIIALNKELEEAKSKADAANRAKTIFLNNMSHDIRTPMNAILGFTKLMEHQAENPQVIKDYLAKISASGEHLLSVINNVLDMARIDSGELELDEEFVDIGTGDVPFEDMFSESIQRKKLHFTAALDIRHRYVIADISKVNQIIINLVSNAIKYTPEGGCVELFSREVPCERAGYATYVITVKDNGIGMSEEFQKHIFEQFTRERNSTHSKIMGTGLGMPIVKKLVDFMGGTIEVESEVAKGSLFRVTLTQKIVEDPEQYMRTDSEKIRNTADLRGKHILLVEDNDLNAEIAIAILEEVGMHVDRAEDGIECLDILEKSEEGDYDLILMDIQMPELDGYQTTEKIRAKEKAGEPGIPIIAMTANAFEEDRQHALSVGMNAHVAKPIDVDVLLDTLLMFMKDNS